MRVQNGLYVIGRHLCPGFLWGWRHNPRDMEVCLSLPMPPRPGVRTHQQSIHPATNIAAEVRDAIRGTEIADSGVRLDELVSPDAPQITLMIESQCSRAALGLLIRVAQVIRGDWTGAVSDEPGRPRRSLNIELRKS